MNSAKNHQLAMHFLEKLGAGASAEEISSLCAPELSWDIPGDSGVLPWVGHKTGRQAMFDFLVDTQTMIVRESLDIEDVLASETRAVVLGHLRTRIVATGKVIDTSFAIVLTFSHDLISSFLMLEDSFATSIAARE